MPIVRTYQCPECFHRIEATLTSEQWDIEEPFCPQCDARTNQEFTPPAIGGSNIGKAKAMAEKIAAEDYGVSNMWDRDKYGKTPKVEYKDDMMGVPRTADRNWGSAGQSSWGVTGAALDLAMANGRQLRRKFGDGLDVLQSALKTGAQPDLMEASKKRAMRVW